MISYTHPRELRIRRSVTPEPPFWCATTVSPYSSRREIPISIDYEQLRASSAERLEVRVSADPADYLDREEIVATIPAPVLIESTGAAEAEFGRGAEIADWCASRTLPFMQLVSAESFASSKATVTVLSAWPADLSRLEEIVAKGAPAGSWGIFVPVVFPLTTTLPFLEGLVALARRHRASFLASAAIEIEPVARKAIVDAAAESDHEVFDTLFHSDLDALATASERQIAALAHDAGLADHVLLPDPSAKSNWNVATFLARTAGRLIRMREEVETAWDILRSAQIIASLDKPIDRVAAAARLSIIRGLDPISVQAAEEWLAGDDPSFVREVDKRWRANP